MTDSEGVGFEPATFQLAAINELHFMVLQGLSLTHSLIHSYTRGWLLPALLGFYALPEDTTTDWEWDSNRQPAVPAELQSPHLLTGRLLLFVVASHIFTEFQ